MFTAQVNITDYTLFSLFASALEGGSNYWYMIQKSERSTKKDYDGNIDYDGEAAYPFKGGALYIDDSQADSPTMKKPKKITRASLQTGLGIMAREYPKHFADLIEDNEDCITGDVFLQCCVLGEVIYG